MRATRWTIRGLLAVLFLATGTMKLVGAGPTIETFDALGLGLGGRLLVGLLEVSGALGLLVTPLAPFAALGLAVIMVGAILSHLLVLGPSAVPAAIALGLCLAVAWLEREIFDVVTVLRTGKGPMDGWFARAYDAGVQGAFREMLPALTRDLLPQLRGARRLLDVGCGPGQVTVFAAEELPEAEVWGVDLAPTMIELARQHARLSPARSRLRFEVGDVARLPFPDDTFDVVMSTGSIKHWRDPAAGLAEIHRVLAPGGRTFIAEMNRLAPPAAIAVQRARLRHWLFRLIYPRVFTRALTPEDAHRAFRASPFEVPFGERSLLDGCLWLFEARKDARVGDEPRPPAG